LRRQAAALVLVLLAVLVACALAGALPTAEATGRSLSASPSPRADGRRSHGHGSSSGSGSKKSSYSSSSSSSSSSRRRDEEGHSGGSSEAANLRLAAPGLRAPGFGVPRLPPLLPARQLGAAAAAGGKAANNNARAPSSPSHQQQQKQQHNNHRQQEGTKPQQHQEQQQDEAAQLLAQQRAATAALLPAGTPQWATNLIRPAIDTKWSEQMQDLVLPHGYPLQIFNLTTRDGYVLTVHRIPYGRSPQPPPLDVWPSGMDPSGAAAQLHSAYLAMKGAVSNVTSLLTGGWLTLESGMVQVEGSNGTAVAEPKVAAAMVAPPLASSEAAAPAKKLALLAAAKPPASSANATATTTTTTTTAQRSLTIGVAGDANSAAAATTTDKGTAAAAAAAASAAGALLGQAGGKVVSAGGKVVDWGQQAGALVLRPVAATLHKVAGVAAAGMDAVEGVMVVGPAAQAAAKAKAQAAAAAKAAASPPAAPPPKPIAMLIHGLSVSSAGWVVLGPSDSLAFKLADAGYDVWMPNTRGSLYSQKHLSLQPNEKAFWAYSLDEQAVVDLPAFIDLALKVTGAPSLTLMGHSQGGILELMTLAARPEYNDKVDLALGLAPVYFPSMIATPLIRFMLNLEMYKLLGILTAAGVQDVVPNWMIGRLLGAPQCSTGLLVESVGPPCLSLIHTSLAGKYGFISPSDFDAISRTWPASVGLRNLLHWVEIAKEPSKTNAIVPWPCGEDCAKCADSPVALASCRAREAMKKRGGLVGGGNNGTALAAALAAASPGGGGLSSSSSSPASSRIPTPVIPAEYNLSRITTKIAVLGGDLDLLAPPESYRHLKSRLPEGSFVEYDAAAEAGHMDITWGRKAPWYTAAVAMMRKHARGVPQPGRMGGAGLEPTAEKVVGKDGWTAVCGGVVIRDEAAVEAALRASEAAEAEAAEAALLAGARERAPGSAEEKQKKKRGGGWFGGLFGGGGPSRGGGGGGGGFFGLGGRRD
jgi:pimeloyl-ACP methyl ester carboxylesterase